MKHLTLDLYPGWWLKLMLVIAGFVIVASISFPIALGVLLIEIGAGLEFHE